VLELAYRCPDCEPLTKLALTPDRDLVKCRICSQERALRQDAWQDGGITHCVVCGTEDLYSQKDFPQGLGLAILVAGFGLSSLFWLWYMPIAAFGVLIASVIVDAILYALVPDVVICYRCLSQYRGNGSNPSGRYRNFDLAVGERYRQERMRVEELRRQRQSQDPCA
jgi:hypothetical protein